MRVHFRQSRIFNKAFTFIEVVVAMGIFATLFAISSPHILKIKDNADLSTTLTTFISDVKQQQIKAMSGSDNLSDTTADVYGIYIETHKYVLFKGPLYESNSPLNTTIALDAPLEFNPIMLPSSQIVFASGSGELLSYDPNNRQVTLKNSINNEVRTVRFNQLGIITEVTKE